MKVYVTMTLGLFLMGSVLFSCGGSSGDGGNGDTGLGMGLLQFKVNHNLQDDSCLPDQCDLTWEEETDTAGWLTEIAGLSNMAVLHWDRPIPWLAFDADPGPGISRVDFFDGRIDAGLRQWIDAFATHFEQMPLGYLAVSLLSGDRNGLERFRVDASQTAAVTGPCPVLAPGTQIDFQYNPGGGLVNASFDLQRSYTNLIMYLYDKLQPDYLALMVEVNLFKEPSKCPAQWDGLAQLYRQIYDTVRPQVDPRTKVFATLTLHHLLGYDIDACHGSLAFELCTGDPSPPAYPDPDPVTCYPLNLGAIDDLDQGDRLEILALSFYPDALMMDVAANNLLKLYPGNWDGIADCDQRAQATPYLDPAAALDRFNWDKPMAIAELGARSQRTLQMSGGFFVQPPGDLTSQGFWLDHFLTVAQERDFEFYVQAFSDDYNTIGAWTVHNSIFDAATFSLLNNFAYMGLYDAQGLPKAGVTQTWLDALP